MKLRFSAALLLLSAACAPSRPAATAPATHAPADAALYRAIAQQDSLLFVAFNRHDLPTLQTFFAEDLEFYHDKGGLTNFAQTMQGFGRLFEQNRTTGLRRVLVLVLWRCTPSKATAPSKPTSTASATRKTAATTAAPSRI